MMHANTNNNGPRAMPFADVTNERQSQANQQQHPQHGGKNNNSGFAPVKKHHHFNKHQQQQYHQQQQQMAPAPATDRMLLNDFNQVASAPSGNGPAPMGVMTAQQQQQQQMQMQFMQFQQQQAAAMQHHQVLQQHQHHQSMSPDNNSGMMMMMMMNSGSAGNSPSPLQQQQQQQQLSSPATPTHGRSTPNSTNKRRINNPYAWGRSLSNSDLSRMSAGNSPVPHKNSSSPVQQQQQKQGQQLNTSASSEDPLPSPSDNVSPVNVAQQQSNTVAGAGSSTNVSQQLDNSAISFDFNGGNNNSNVMQQQHQQQYAMARNISPFDEVLAAPPVPASVQRQQQQVHKSNSPAAAEAPLQQQPQQSPLQQHVAGFPHPAESIDMELMKLMDAAKSTPVMQKVIMRFPHRAALFTSHFAVKSGDVVLVEGDRGCHIGIVDMAFDAAMNVNLRLPPGPRHRGGSLVLRHASPDEAAAYQEMLLDEANIVERCRRQVYQRRIAMNIVHAEFQFDRKVLILFFTSEARVDFNLITKDLFRVFNCRIFFQVAVPLKDQLATLCVTAHNGQPVALPNGNHNAAAAPVPVADENEQQQQQQQQEDQPAIPAPQSKKQKNNH